MHGMHWPTSSPRVWVTLNLFCRPIFCGCYALCGNSMWPGCESVSHSDSGNSPEVQWFWVKFCAYSFSVALMDSECRHQRQKYLCILQPQQIESPTATVWGVNVCTWTEDAVVATEGGEAGPVSPYKAWILRELSLRKSSSSGKQLPVLPTASNGERLKPMLTQQWASISPSSH